ncbi:hypothetical protein Hanom_Chr07g00590481 [Helianthus anomalus]
MFLKSDRTTFFFFFENETSLKTTSDPNGQKAKHKQNPDPNGQRAKHLQHIHRIITPFLPTNIVELLTMNQTALNRIFTFPVDGF